MAATLLIKCQILGNKETIVGRGSQPCEPYILEILYTYLLGVPLGDIPGALLREIIGKYTLLAIILLGTAYASWKIESPGTDIMTM